MTAEPIAAFEFSPHAHAEMSRRGLSEAVVAQVLRSPEQRYRLRPGRDVVQSRVHVRERAKTYLIRVIVDLDRVPAVVVTAYRTSKLEKYWRREP